MKVKTGLYKAARRIQRRGWTRYSFCDNKRRVCLVGSLQYAFSGRAGQNPLGAAAQMAYNKARGILQGLMPRRGGVGGVGRVSLINYNDKIAKDKAEVVALLKRAAWLAKN